MNPEEVARACDELHECLDQGPGENPGVHARALSVLRRLRGAAAKDELLGLLAQTEAAFGSWFSRQECNRSEAEDRSQREQLVERLAELEEHWS